MFISIILVLNFSLYFFFNSVVNNYSCLGRRRKGVFKSVVKERGIRSIGKMEKIFFFC